MAGFSGLPEAEDRAARHHFSTVRDEVFDEFLQIEKHRLPVYESHHVHPEGRLHGRELVEVVENHLGHGALLEVDADADLFGRLVAHLGDALELLFAHEFVHALVKRTLVDHVGNLVDDDAGAVLAGSPFLKVRAGADDDAAAPRAVALMHFRKPEDDPARRKVGRGHERNEIVHRAVGVFQAEEAGFDRLAHVVRRNIRCHPHGNARRAVHKELRQPGREHHGLHFGIVEVRREVDRFLIDVGQRRRGDLFEADFGVTHGGGIVAVNRAEVPLTVHERVAHREILRETHDRHVGRQVAVRMVLTEHFPHDAGRLLVRIVVRILDLVHRVENAAMHGFQTVADIGQRAAHNHAHGVIEVGALHLRLKRNGEQFPSDGVGGLHKIKSLANIVAFHKLRTHLIKELQRLEGFVGGQTVRSKLGIGHGALIEVARSKQRLAVLDLICVRTPQNELADGIRKARPLYAVTFVNGLLGRLGVSRQQHVIGRTVLDLAIEHTGGAEAQNQLVAGLLFKNRSQFFGRSRKVGGHSYMHFSCAHAKNGTEQRGGNGGFDEFHVFFPKLR